MVEVNQEEFIKRRKTFPQVEIKQHPQMDCVQAMGRWYGAIMLTEGKPRSI